MTNEELCALAKKGDVDAQNSLIEENIRFIRKTAYEVWSAEMEINASLGIGIDDLVQEGSLGLLECVAGYNPDSGFKFLTYASPAIRNAMIDYIRRQSVSFEAKNMNVIISLDKYVKDENASKYEVYADPTQLNPEQIYLEKERDDDVHTALKRIDVRESAYLGYRFGFDEADVERPMTEAARYFHLSTSRAKSMEKQELDDVWLELPWWY